MSTITSIDQIRTPAAARAGSLSWRRLWLAAAFTVDLVIATGLIAIATLVPRIGIGPDEMAIAAAVSFATLAARGWYRPRIRRGFTTVAHTAVVSTGIASGTLLLLDAATHAGEASLWQPLRFWLPAAAFFTVGRLRLNRTLTSSRTGTATGLPTLIIGAGNVGQLVARRLHERPDLGLTPVGFLDKDPVSAGADRRFPVLGASWDLEKVVSEKNVAFAIVTFSTAPTPVLLNVIRRCEELGVEVALVPRLFEAVPRKLHVEHLGGLPILEVQPANPRGWQFGLKHAIDRIVALLMLPLLAPVLAACALAVRISLGKPVFFRQQRVGRDGRVFEMLKFRSMREPSPGDDTTFDLPGGVAPGGVEGPDRRTRVGRFLRSTSLDELPQIINVLTGDMSFIGPRPERPEFARQFTANVHRYDDRHRAKSGITGWAQVNGLRGKTSIGDRAEWDNYYIENWSFGLDLKILLLTFRAVLSHSSVE